MIRALLVVIAAQFALAGCSAKPILRFPAPLQEEVGEDLTTAYERASRAHASCAEELEENAFPLMLPLSVGTGALAFALVGGAAAAVVFSPDPNIGIFTGGGLLLLAAGAGTASITAASGIPAAMDRTEVRRTVLDAGRRDAAIALDEKDAVELDAAARDLYENCRVAAVVQDANDAAILFRDLQRYRREARAARRWEKRVGAEQKDLEAINGKLSTQLDEARSKVRALEEELDKAKAPPPPATPPAPPATSPPPAAPTTSPPTTSPPG